MKKIVGEFAFVRIIGDDPRLVCAADIGPTCWTVVIVDVPGKEKIVRFRCLHHVIAETPNPARELPVKPRTDLPLFDARKTVRVAAW